MGTETLKTRHARAVAFTLVLLLTTALTPPAQAQVPDNSWIGGSSINWSDGGNWTGSTPATTAIVGFDVAGALNQPTLDVDPTIAGLLMNATGNNTLTLAGHTLTITGLATQSGGMLTGAGTVVVGTYNLTGGTIAPGSGIGTITFIGNFAQSGSSTYQVDVNAGGQSDRIVVTGTATLNGGTVAVQAAPGAYQRNTAYTILTATGGRTGTYAAVTSNFAFLTPTLTYDANNVMLTLLSSANSFQSGAQTANQRAVGSVLDLASPTATGDFANVLNAIYGLDTVQGPRVLDALGGQNYSAFSSLMVQGAQLFMNSFQFQAGAGGGATYQALKTDDCPPNANACDVEPLWGVWGGGLGAFGTVQGDVNAAGVTYNLGGFTAGLDRRFAPNFRAGIATGFNAASLYTVGMPGYGTSNTLQFALYGEYLEGPFYLDALAGYAHSDNRMTRPLVIPGLPYRAAQGYTTANTFFGQLEAGYKVVVAPSFGGFVTPFVRLQASTSTQNGFTETGADSL
ncbi:MAG TPA: autotransporter domain-containing protein, partial [Reyranella sp.]|nr:autotransporter domain-containing protein [Reyranella sp.]